MFRKRDQVKHEVYFTLPSMTIPDQALTMREILDRYAKGLPLGGNDINTAIYDEESSGINPKTFDLTDIENIHEETLEKVRKLQSKTKKKITDEKPKVVVVDENENQQ